MHPLVALIVGGVLAWAIQRRNREATLGWWRPVAGMVGGLVPYMQGVVFLFGAGLYWQVYQGLFWSLALAPFFSGLVAALLAWISRQPWHQLIVPVLVGHVAAIVLAMLTEEGVFPLFMLVPLRVAVGILHPFDMVLVAVGIMTLVAGAVFRDFRRDIARLGLVCMVLYLPVPAYYAYEARAFGRSYAEAMNLGVERLVALPQPLSVLNWRVIVSDDDGRVHDTLVNLRRTSVVDVEEGDTRAKRIDALYRPVNLAVWRVYRRFGVQQSATDQRRVDYAWQAWQRTPYGWLGRYAVYEELVMVPQGRQRVLCVQFMDLRRDGSRREERGQFVVCPARSGQARIFRPHGDDRYTEWVPWMGVM